MTTFRNYVSASDIEEYADITITDSAEGDDRIGQAEEIVDAYVGPQLKFFDGEITGYATGGSTTSLSLQSDQTNIYENDYFKGMYLEILGGSSSGSKALITGSTKAGVLSFSALSTAISSSSFYKIMQLGKFPRCEDVVLYTTSTPYTYFKTIPDQIKKAVAAQLQYMIEMGDKFFSTDKSQLKSETIDNYSYTNSDTNAINKLIAPKAKMLLRGYKNIRGAIII